MHLIYRLAGQHQSLEYKGTIDSIEALKWLDAIEEVMFIFTMIDIKKIKYATYLLRGDAKLWWRLLYASCLRDMGKF